jgi:DNA-binding transcriptional regulator YhcF (GntR family)
VSAASREKATVAVLLPKPLRAEWVDAMALDPDLSNNAFRVACVIGSYFNKFRADAYPSMGIIAEKMNATTRTVWNGITELEARGYLIVKRRHLGTYIRKEKTGGETEVRLAGGKGVSNTYYPAFQRSQISSTNTKSKLEEICDLYWSQRSKKSASKAETDFDPTLASSSSKKKNPTRPREALPSHALGSAGDRLRDLIGPDEFAAWFGSDKVRVESETGDTVTLSAPNVFVRTQILERYKLKLERALQWARPETAVVNVIVRQSRGST